MGTRSWITGLAVALTGLVAACGSSDTGPSGSRTAATEPPALPRGADPVELDPSDFTTEIDNPYWPMTPGRTWVFRETDGEGTEQRVEVTVTGRTTRIIGITARVVRDVVSEEGRLVEVTDDWYAQDRWGNIWYLGEATQEYEAGKPVSTGGSWRAGDNGAQPGIALPGTPTPGLAYRQEYLKGEAEDAAKVLRLGDRVTVPAGTYDDVLVTADTTPLEPGLVENKFYARGVGPVRAETVAGGQSTEVLLEVRDR